jgi:hypothetical protein
LVHLIKDPRFVTAAQLIAREVGDSTTEARLREYSEREFEPRVFGDENDRFGWWFDRKELYPRGQLSALQMLCELGDPGAWSRVFNQPNLRKFDEPTVAGVDYPSLGVCEAWNDTQAGVLRVATYAATPSRRGARTTFQVRLLPDARVVRVRCDGVDYPRWRVVGEDTIELECEIADHRFEIALRGAISDDTSERRNRGVSLPAVTETGSESRAYVPAVPPTCAAPCCSTRGRTI